MSVPRGSGTVAPALRSLRENNFDLLRLLAATQVAVTHADTHLHFQGSLAPWLCRLLRHFPGVPVFFVISGYLISLSLNVNPSLRDYLRNRALRIFPGLWVCQLVTIATVVWLHRGWPEPGLHTALQILKWFAEAFTVIPVATPSFLQGWATGGLNGSLWTISVELQFYLFLPLFLAVLSRTRLNANAVLLALVALLYPLGSWYEAHLQTYWSVPGYQLLSITCLPYLHMFLLGVLLQRNFLLLRRWLEGRALLWFALYVAAAWLLEARGISVETNVPNILCMVLLAGGVVSAAYTLPALGERLLHREDISYGVYIYHMVVINVLFVLGLVAANTYIVAALVLTFLLAYLSWRFVEKPCLALKRHPLRAVAVAGVDGAPPLRPPPAVGSGPP